MHTDASANIFQDYVERTQRPEVSPDQAVVQLLDARGVLYELRVRPCSLPLISHLQLRCIPYILPEALVLQDLAKTDKNSDERFRARSLLPGIAKRLREVHAFSQPKFISFFLHRPGHWYT